MKRIEAIVRREKLGEVKVALASVAHRSFSACDTTEHDPNSQSLLRYRGTSSVSDMAPRVTVSVVVDEAHASAAVDAIAAAARTGREGDGTIVVVPVEEVLQISGPVASAG
jgi:nitrogen regulatory protein P-II 1